jgi:hypothetical protein
MSKVAFRPRNIGNVYRVHLACFARCLEGVASDGTPEVEILRTCSVLDLDGLEDLLPTDQSMRAFLVDGNSIDLQPGLMDRRGILRGA